MQGKRTRALDSRGRPVKGLYVRDGRFVAGLQEGGRWTMRTLEAESLTEARREREALIADLASGRAAPRSGVTFAQAFADWQGSRTLAERTIRDERAVARRYVSKLLTRRIQDVSGSDAASVLHANRHLAHWTRVHIYRVLAGTFAHALRRGLVSRNPMDGISKAERPRQRNKRNVARLVSADVDRLIAAASTDRDRAAIGLAAYAGLRIGEVRAAPSTGARSTSTPARSPSYAPAWRTDRSRSRSRKPVSVPCRCCRRCGSCSSRSLAPTAS
jgi:hypothetical protein